MNKPEEKSSKNTFQDRKQATLVMNEVRSSLQAYPLGASVSAISMNTGHSVVFVSEALARMAHTGQVRADVNGVWRTN